LLINSCQRKFCKVLYSYEWLIQSLSTLSNTFFVFLRWVCVFQYSFFLQHLLNLIEAQYNVGNQWEEFCCGGRSASKETFVKL
jgi:hypothetical protein